MMKYFVTSLFFLSCFSVSAQKTVTIGGKLSGLGNAKMYLGNKPNGITRGFHYVIFDSVYAKDDVFEFKDFKFNETGFYSIAFEGSSMWQTFLIDTGKIFIAGKKDSIYEANVTGSHENDLYHLYKKYITDALQNEGRANFDSLDKYRSKDSVRYQHFLGINKQLASRFLNQQKTFIRQHPCNYVALIALHDIEKQLSHDSLRYYINLLSQQVKENSNAAVLKYKAGDFYKNMEPGSVVPDFSLSGINGYQTKLHDIQAPFKLIVFWASWCAPCLAELPKLKTFQSQHANVRLISFSIDLDKHAWENATIKNEISWPSFSDLQGPSGKLPAYFGVQQIPLMILLDEENRIVKYDISMGELEAYFK